MFEGPVNTVRPSTSKANSIHFWKFLPMTFIILHHAFTRHAYLFQLVWIVLSDQQAISRSSSPHGSNFFHTTALSAIAAALAALSAAFAAALAALHAAYP
jgi:hypothetical protein